MKFTEIPFFMLKDFFLRAPGMSTIPYNELILMSKEDFDLLLLEEGE
jgi:hypothetical protein